MVAYNDSSSTTGFRGFGWDLSISADGTVAVVGSLYTYSLSVGVRFGGAFIFNRVGSEWKYSSAIIVNDSLTDERFGAITAISGDGKTIALASDNNRSLDRPNQVNIYKYENSIWVLKQKLLEPELTAELRSNYGYIICFNNDSSLLAISTNKDQTSNSYIYVYKLIASAYVLQQTILEENIQFSYTSMMFDMTLDGSAIVTSKHSAGNLVITHYSLNGSTNKYTRSAEYNRQSLSNAIPNNIKISNDGNTITISQGATAYVESTESVEKINGYQGIPGGGIIVTLLKVGSNIIIDDLKCYKYAETGDGLGRSGLHSKTMAMSGDGRRVCASGGFNSLNAQRNTYVASFVATDYVSKILCPRNIVYNSMGYSSSISDDGDVLLVLNYGLRRGDQTVSGFTQYGATICAFKRVGQKCFSYSADVKIDTAYYWTYGNAIATYLIPEQFDLNPDFCAGFYQYNGTTAAICLYGSYTYNMLVSNTLKLDANGNYSSFSNGASGYVYQFNKTGYGKGIAISKDCLTAAVGNISNIECSVTIGAANQIGGGLISEFNLYNKIKPNYTPPFPGINFDSFFGYSISLSDNGSKMAVGAPNSYDVTYSPAVRKGRVYYYTIATDQYTQLRTVVGDPLIITADNQLNDTYFGYNVKLSPDGTMIIVGAPRENSEAGAIYVYKISNNVATQTQKITSPNGGRYGAAISFVNNKVLVSAPSCTVDGKPTAGRIYQYVSTGSTLTFIRKIEMPDARACDYFGMALDRSIVGTDQYGIEDVIVSGAYGRTESEEFNADCSNLRYPPNTIGTIRGFFNPPK